MKVTTDASTFKSVKINYKSIKQRQVGSMIEVAMSVGTYT